MQASKHYYHCASKGLSTEIIFKDEAGFVAGMNRIAFCLAALLTSHPLILICFCLMDNHVHFVLYGTRESCLAFMAHYYRLTGMWCQYHEEDYSPGERWEYDAWLIPDREKLKEKIAYVHRNPQVAGFPYTPSGYRWSSAGLPFHDQTVALKTGRRLEGLSTYEQRKLLGTRINLPGDWLILPDGLIWPGSYTDYPRIERVFGSVGNYMFSLNQKVEINVNQEMMSGSISLPDGDVAKMAKEIAFSKFAVRDTDILSVCQRIEVCRLLRKKAWATSKQLARVFHIPQEALKEIIG
jgi:hypothetical protein